MSRARVAVLKVITKEMTATAAAEKYGYSRRQLQRLLARYRQDGIDAVEPRSRRPHSNSAATPTLVRDRIIELRLQLTKDGKMSFRRAGRMHHLGIGAAHARKRVLAIADDTTVTVIELETAEVLSTHQIQPTKTYWRNTRRPPGRWPGGPQQ